MIKNCLFCGKKFNAKSHIYKYCCHRCSSNASLGHKDTEETKKKRSISLMGHPVSDKVKRIFLEYTKNKIPWNKGKKNTQQSGEKHWHWRGGVTGERKKLMNTFEYKTWRTCVFVRDHYTCVWCGDHTSGNLEADHIKKWIDFPELRFVVENGRTLCKKCHKATDTYGKQKKKEIHNGIL